MHKGSCLSGRGLRTHQLATVLPFTYKQFECKALREVCHTQGSPLLFDVAGLLCHKQSVLKCQLAFAKGVHCACQLHQLSLSDSIRVLVHRLCCARWCAGSVPFCLQLRCVVWPHLNFQGVQWGAWDTSALSVVTNLPKYILPLWYAACRLATLVCCLQAQCLAPQRS